MSQGPLNLQQATSLCDAHKDLKGAVRMSEKGDFEVIEEVALVPYGNINRQLYFFMYRELQSKVKAIEFYKGVEYEVVIILREIVAVGEGYLRHMDIWAYMKETGNYINISVLKGV